MKVTPLALPEVLMVEPDIFPDERGAFFELWHQDRYAVMGLPATFVQDNVSTSKRGVLRGMHFQEGMPQGKLVTVLSGVIWDVAADIRLQSRTFGRWVAAELSCTNSRQLYIPEGFAHGFVVLSESATVHYKCTRFYEAERGQTVLWSDPTLRINWPITNPLLSTKDAAAPLLTQLYG